MVFTLFFMIIFIFLYQRYSISQVENQSVDFFHGQNEIQTWFVIFSVSSLTYTQNFLVVMGRPSSTGLTMYVPTGLYMYKYCTGILNFIIKFSPFSVHKVMLKNGHNYLRVIRNDQDIGPIKLSLWARFDGEDMKRHLNLHTRNKRAVTISTFI